MPFLEAPVERIVQLDAERERALRIRLKDDFERDLFPETATPGLFHKIR